MKTASTIALFGSSFLILMSPGLAQEPKLLATLDWHQERVSCVRFSPDGTTLASVSENNQVLLSDVVTSKLKATFKCHDKQAWSVAWSPDGKTLAVGGDLGVKLLDVETGEVAATYAMNSMRRNIAWSPDGKVLAAGDVGNAIKLWDVATGKEKFTFTGHEGWLWSVAFSPDSKTLASGGHDSMLKLWDVATGEERTTLTAHKGRVSVAFSPDGKSLFSGSGPAGQSGGEKPGKVKLWDLETYEEKANFEGHADTVFCVAFSSDGKTLASGGDEGSIRLWNADIGKPLAVLHGDTNGRPYSIAFSPNGKLLASGWGDQSVRVWDVSMFSSTDK